MGVLGIGAGLRELVSARLRQPAGLFDSACPTTEPGALDRHSDSRVRAKCHRHAVRLRDHAVLTSANCGSESWRSAPVRPTTSVRLDSRPLRAPSAEIRTAVARNGRAVDSGSPTARRSPSEIRPHAASSERRGRRYHADTFGRAVSAVDGPQSRTDAAPTARVLTRRCATPHATRCAPSARAAAAVVTQRNRSVSQDRRPLRATTAGRGTLVAIQCREPPPGARQSHDPTPRFGLRSTRRHAPWMRSASRARREPSNGVRPQQPAPAPAPESTPLWRARTPAPDAPRAAEPERRAAPRVEPSGGPADSGWSRPNPSSVRESAPAPAPARPPPPAQSTGRAIDFAEPLRAGRVSRRNRRSRRLAPASLVTGVRFRAAGNARRSTGGIARDRGSFPLAARHRSLGQLST